MAIQQAGLEPVVLSASGHERIVNGRATAMGEESVYFIRTNRLIRLHDRSGQAQSIGTDRGNEAPGATWRIKSRPRNRYLGEGFSLVRVFAFPRLPT